MAVSFVGQQNSAGTSSFSVNWPFGWVAGDLILVFVETPNTAVTTPSGFSVISGTPQSTGSSGTGVRLSGFYRVAQSGDTTSVSIAGFTDHAVATVMAYTGVDTSTPFDVTPVGGVEATSDTSGATGTSITTVSANCRVVVAFADGADSGAVQYNLWTNANLSSVTERVDAHSTAGNGGGVGVAEGLKASAGAVGSTTVTLGLAASKCFLTLALRPYVAPAIPSSCGILIG